MHASLVRAEYFRDIGKHNREKSVGVKNCIKRNGNFKCYGTEVAVKNKDKKRGSSIWKDTKGTKNSKTKDC